MRCLKSLAVIGLILSMASVSVAADWPNWRSPDYTGVSTETDWNPAALTSPTIVWKTEIGTGYSAVSVADGFAYTIGNIDKQTDVIYCFDALTGAEKWTYKYPEPLTPNMYEGGCNATPTVYDGKVYTLSKTGKAFCFDAKTGDVIWKKTLPYKKPGWGFAGSPVIVEDKVIYNVGDAGAALNKNDGSVVWKSADEKAGYASPVPFQRDGKTLLAMFCAKDLKIVDAATGKIIAAHEWKTSWDVNAADPIVSGDEIFITSGYGHGASLVKFDGASLTEVWKNKNMRSQMSGPVLINGYLYGMDDKQLACVNWKTGEQLWTEKSTKQGALCGAGDKLIILGEKGDLMIADASPEGFKLISSAKVLSNKCWTMPVIANGRIYVRDADKNKPDTLVCVDVQIKSTKLLTLAVLPEDKAQWPQWQGPNRDNLSTETGLAKQWPESGPLELWTAEGLGAGYASAAIANGKIYTTGRIDEEGFLFCLDMNGKLLWKQSYGPEWKKSFPGTRCTPTIDDGFIYVTSSLGTAICFKAETGKQIWLADPITDLSGKCPPWGYGESMLSVGDKVVMTIGGEKAILAALNKKDGTLAWTTPGNGDANAYCSPVSFEWAGKTVIAGMIAKHVFAVDAKDGCLLWQFPCAEFVEGKIPICHPNTPFFKDGCLFCTTGYDAGSVLLQISPDGTGAKKVWSNADLDSHHGSFVVVNGAIYGPNFISNNTGNWMCVDWKTGETRYEQPWHNKGSLTYADGMLYCYEEAGGTVGLVKADPSGFEVVSSFTVTHGDKEHWAHPVVCGKRLYIRHGSTLTAYDIAG